MRAGSRRRGFELISTGGTARALAAAGLAVTEVAALTGFPEIMDGRVKTLHPKVHGALLGRAGIDDAVMREHGIDLIDVAVINLYPFAETIAKPGCAYQDAIENIDVGGPAMLRAAAKNHARVAVLVDPADYAVVLNELSAGGVSEPTRRRLAAKAFGHTAQYDALVSGWLRAPTRRRRLSRNPSQPVSARSRTCATARTRTSAPLSTPTRSPPARASRPRGSCRARNSPSTTSPTRIPPSSAFASSKRPPA